MKPLEANLPPPSEGAAWRQNNPSFRVPGAFEVVVIWPAKPKF